MKNKIIIFSAIAIVGLSLGLYFYTKKPKQYKDNGDFGDEELLKIAENIYKYRFAMETNKNVYGSTSEQYKMSAKLYSDEIKKIENNSMNYVIEYDGNNAVSINIHKGDSRFNELLAKKMVVNVDI